MADISIISGTIAEFIDGALTIVLLMIIYYIIRVFMVAPPSKEERMVKRKELEDQRAEWGKWVGGKFKEHKHKVQKEQRKGDVSVVKDNLKDALEGMEDIHSLLNKADLDRVKRTANRVKRDLQRAVGNLRLLRRKHEGEDRKAMQTAIDSLHGIEKMFVDDVEHKLPDKVDPDHTKYVNSVKDPIDAVVKLRGSLGTIWNDLEEFHTKFPAKP
ncbi:hypothetical protein HYT55_04450 [Candidatus Woesearchaeota archaeon]|nr:hypothetical protein [Candidatus Woesearchaeota archaeon]